MFNTCQLKEIAELSGSKGTVYTIILDDNSQSAFTEFIKDNIDSFKSEIHDITSRLSTMGKHTGMREDFFKMKEGELGDGVCALYDKEKSNLRLYCIRYGSQLIILGGGGYKSKKIRSFQQDAQLKKSNYTLRKLSKLITEKMKDKEIFLSEDGLKFEGDLTITNYGN